MTPRTSFTLVVFVQFSCGIERSQKFPLPSEAVTTTSYLSPAPIDKFVVLYGWIGTKSLDITCVRYVRFRGSRCNLMTGNFEGSKRAAPKSAHERIAYLHSMVVDHEPEVIGRCSVNKA